MPDVRLELLDETLKYFIELVDIATSVFRGVQVERRSEYLEGYLDSADDLTLIAKKVKAHVAASLPAINSTGRCVCDSVSSVS